MMRPSVRHDAVAGKELGLVTQIKQQILKKACGSAPKNAS
jgi:hypothetical protein